MLSPNYSKHHVTLITSWGGFKPCNIEWTMATHIVITNRKLGFLLEILVKKYQIWIGVWKTTSSHLGQVNSTCLMWLVGLFTKPRLAFLTCQSNMLSTWLVIKLTLVGSFFIATCGYLITIWLVKSFTYWFDYWSMW
jgi:hypothetical protein